ncbi:hypothetical protein HYH39_02240 [Clostridium botulinum]|nr:hypothetical protein KU40_07010 [Clostridium botulinum]MBY6850947.1 hypothetical protein [Clostridium botulinum]NFI71553.1 hypothetical protein [Clostridium botulinum]NFI92643.1 hypothetical protein [Clostridium botulinum]NFQ82605.1 hypothetical protein [Clostridium botulinum]
MLEKATVTMPYIELKELIDKNNEYKERLNKIKNIKTMTEEEFELNPFKKALDYIFDLLEKASNQTGSNEKQYFIYQCMKKYCRTFDIQEDELLEGVPKGKDLSIMFVKPPRR